MSVPAATTLALPLTGAESIAVPRRRAASRTWFEPSSDTVEQSIKSLGQRCAPSTPSAPVVTAMRSSEAETVLKTMSRSLKSFGESTIVAPSAASGSTLLRVRL